MKSFGNHAGIMGWIAAPVVAVLYIAARALACFAFSAIDFDQGYSDILSSFVLVVPTFIIWCLFGRKKDLGRRERDCAAAYAVAILAAFFLACLSKGFAAFLKINTAYSPSFLRLCSYCLSGPLTEEIIYRGLALNWCRTKAEKILSAVVSTLLFASVHAGMRSAFIALIGGVLFTLLYLRWNMLRFSVIAHCITNCLVLLPGVDPKLSATIGICGVLCLSSLLLWRISVEK